MEISSRSWIESGLDSCFLGVAGIKDGTESPEIRSVIKCSEMEAEDPGLSLGVFPP